MSYRRPPAATAPAHSVFSRPAGRLQHFPDDCGGTLHSFVPAGDVRPQAHRGEGRLHDVRRPYVSPVLTRKCVEGHHPIPITEQRLHGLLVRLVVRPHECIAPPLAVGVRLRIRHRFQRLGRLLLGLLRQIVEDIGDLVVPAPLLLPGRMELAEGCPDPEVPVGHRELWEREPSVLEIAQDHEPTLLALALTALAGQHDLLSRGERAHDREAHCLGMSSEKFRIKIHYEHV